MKKLTKLCTTLFIIASVILILTVYSCAETIEAKETAPTVTELVVNWCSENSSSIFTAMTFICSLILAFVYKRGLLPSLSEGLTKISAKVVSGVDSLTDITDSFSKSTDDNLRRFADQITPALDKANRSAELAEKLSVTIKDMKKSLDASKTDREVMSNILKLQSDMFYGFFMSANLPQYQKDQLGQRYTDMQKVISRLEYSEHEDVSTQPIEEAVTIK